MKATGIVRRVDDLGRIVIPKEVRRTLGIMEGTPMELFVDGNKVIFQKYGLEVIKNRIDELENVIYEEEFMPDKEKRHAAKEHIEALKKILSNMS